MKTWVIYDSVFGNTEKIARAIAEALGPQDEVELARAGKITPTQLSGAGLIIVGSPTRGFRPTKDAADLLKSIPDGSLSNARVAAFDTRVEVKEINNLLLTVLVKIFGYAAEPLAKALQKKGGQLIAQPEGFIVQASEGPLKEGEIERAVAWAVAIKAQP